MINRLMRFGAVLLLVAVTALLIVCSSKKSGGPIQGPVYLATDFFVSTTSGDDANTGKKEAPFATIQRGIDTAAVTGGRVFVAEGVYPENLIISAGVSIFGGYADETFTKDASVVTTILGSDVTIGIMSSDTITIEGFTIICNDAVLPGGSSVAISMNDARGITIKNNVIHAGNGIAGQSGTKPGPLGKTPNGAAGHAASAENCSMSDCPHIPGGTGGFLHGGSGGEGGAGSASVGFYGWDGQGPDGGSGGEGYALFDTHRGGDGGTGGAGHNVGANGAGGLAFGSIWNGIYIPSNGASGYNGNNGSGGGGGGGGAAVFGRGGAGGGGGAGGYGGLGGSGGLGGGASIAILVSGESEATISNNTITTGTGGAGGVGGAGGDPGTPGSGGAGGDGNLAGFAGGNGGNGGSGKAGGVGGGGGGGPAIGICEGPLSATVISNNIITPGSGGQGGASPVNEGANGHSAEYLKLSL